MPTMGRADLHIHTRYGDGMATVPELLAFIERARPELDVVAITEHDTFRAAEEAADLHARGRFRFGLIPGMEVTTLDGHLLALFIDRPVASFRRMEETLAEVHARGGLAIVPHPLSWLTRSVSGRVLARVAAINGNDGVYFDAIEEFNMSPAGRVSGSRARALNRSAYGLASVGCSDAHFAEAVGSAWTAFDGATPEDLRRAIGERRTQGAPGRHPTLRELGYANVVRQSWRGMMATPRNAGWRRTIRSFIVSHRRAPAPPGSSPP